MQIILQDVPHWCDCAVRLQLNLARKLRHLRSKPTRRRAAKASMIGSVVFLVYKVSSTLAARRSDYWKVLRLQAIFLNMSVLSSGVARKN